MTNGALGFSDVSLTAFRGIERTLDLDFGRRLTIIYGGNATGKSSITQAIEFALSGQVRDLEDGLMSAAVLANTRATVPGRVSLRLNDGTLLVGATDRPRSEIERRFREIGAVDWPERQALPLTTTHVTTQGILAKVLGTDSAVTRHDLSGLCAGAHLRFMVSRAQKLTDHFRQVSSGRNIQSDLRDAQGAYDSAKLLVESLRTTSQAIESPASDIEARLSLLGSQLGFAAVPSVDSVLSAVESRAQENEERLRIIQGLLSRTRELGQAESEATELKNQLVAAQGVAVTLDSQREQAAATVTGVTDRLKELLARRALWLEAISSFESQQQQAATLSAVENRRDAVLSEQVGAREDTNRLEGECELARQELSRHQQSSATLQQNLNKASAQLRILEESLTRIEELPAEHDPGDEHKLQEQLQRLSQLEDERAVIDRDIDAARAAEAALADQLARLSESGQKYVAAMNAMRPFAQDGHCPMCGHDHESLSSLEDAIEKLLAAAMEGADLLRPQFEAAAADLLSKNATRANLANQIAVLSADVAATSETTARRTAHRGEVVSEITHALRVAGLAIAVERESLLRSRSEWAGRVAKYQDDLRVGGATVSESEARLSRVEHALTAKRANVDQLSRLANELSTQFERLRSTAPAPNAAVDSLQVRSSLADSEAVVKQLELEHGQAQAILGEADRRVLEKRSEIAGIDRRLQTIQAFLSQLDAEFTGAGLKRDIVALVDAESRATKRGSELVGLKIKASEIVRQQQALEEGRALQSAKQRFSEAERVLKALQRRQRHLQVRSDQFKTLHAELEALQNDTAEAVVRSIRGPVNVLFQAMTAGCPWELDFRLEDGKLGAVLTDGSAHDVSAMSVLNSAYVNVAAIALRLALASQQRWTRLRAIVLDDPILEMDHLTQSALIDGLEAVLASSASPWRDLQFVLTTWSEDFAVMAAHKLAHLNDGSQDVGDAFVIHRLSSNPDGRTESQRHVPRWRKAAAA